MRKEVRLPFKLRALIIRSEKIQPFNMYYDAKYSELYIDFFRYLIIIFPDKLN
jgi:hypothetical protein